jgi:hypothetical protein
VERERLDKKAEALSKKQADLASKAESLRRARTELNDFKNQHWGSVRMNEPLNLEEHDSDNEVKPVEPHPPGETNPFTYGKPNLQLTKLNPSRYSWDRNDPRNLRNAGVNVGLLFTYSALCKQYNFAHCDERLDVREWNSDALKPVAREDEYGVEFAVDRINRLFRLKIERGIWKTGEDAAQIALMKTRDMKERYMVVPGRKIVPRNVHRLARRAWGDDTGQSGGSLGREEDGLHEGMETGNRAEALIQLYGDEPRVDEKRCYTDSEGVLYFAN